MAQKPNFLKKLISAGLVTASTAAFITCAAGSAMGAAISTVAINDPSALGAPDDWQQGVNNLAPNANAGSIIFLGGPNDINFDAAIGNLGTLNLYGNDGKTLTVTNDNQLVNIISTVDAATVTAVKIANNNNAIAAGLAANAKINLAITKASTFELGNAGAGDILALGNVTLSDNGATLKISANNGVLQGITANAAGNGIVQVNATNVTFAEAITGGLRQLAITDGNSAILAANADFDTKGVTFGNNTSLTINDGVQLTAGNGAVIDSLNANNGTLGFEGDAKVSMSVGSVNGLNAINIADGVVEFQSDAAGLLKATTIALISEDSVMRLTTNAQAVTGNITGAGSVSINGKNMTIKGAIGDANSSLKAINFETNNTLVLTVPAPANNNLYVQNITTTKGPNNGTLELHGNYNIFGNIGDKTTNALALVNIADDGTAGPGDATVTLKQGNSINAQAVQIAAGARNNTLQLEPGTTITGNITTANADNGILTLIKGADGNAGTAVVNGDIGAVGGNAIKSVNLNGNDLIFGGANIYIANGAANGIKFTANETLTLTKNANIVISSNVIVGAYKQGIIDASALATLAFQNATIGAAGKSLGLLNIGASTASLSGGDSYINTLAIGDGGSVQLAHNNYLIANTQNAAGQGKIIINPTVGAPLSSTLLEGTNLGSEGNPLSEINFGSANETILNVGKNVNLYANDITTATANNGSFNFNGGGTNIISGAVGANGKALNNVTVANGTTAKFVGPATFGGVTSIDNTSTLVISDNYTANSIIGAGANNGTLQFSNPEPITVTLNTQAAAVNALAAVNVQGDDIKFETGANNGANPGINITTINFKSDAGLYLPEGVPLDNLTINSTVAGNNISNIPGIFITKANSTIANKAVIGGPNNIVGLGLTTDNGITIQLPKLYAVIGPTADNQGTVTLSGGAGNTAGVVYGLGVEGQKLKSVTVTTNYQNLGNTAVVNLVVNDGLTYQTGGSFGLGFDGKITLGNANGNSTVVFADGINSTATSTVATAKANNGIATYLGDANVGNIGSANAALATTKFTGQNNNKATLQGDIYSKAIDFGTTNLVVNTDNAILNGNTIAIKDNNINVQNNVLTFASGTTTWGGNISVTSTLDAAEGVLGKIEIANGATVNAQNGIALNINVVNDNAANVTTTQNYTLVEGGKNFKCSFATPTIIGGNRFLAYSVIRDNNQDYILTRSNDVGNVLKKDITSSQYANVPGINGNVDTLLNSPTTAAYKNLFLAKNAADSAKFVGSIVTDTIVQEDLLNIAKEQQAQLTNRLNSLRYLGSYESAEMASAEGGAVPQAAVAGGDEPVDNVAYGAWLKPFYAEAHQKKAKGSVAGYKSKTTGGIIGLDTLANDNLMIGAAFGVTKTDIKHQDYKKGDKTEVTGTSFSLYAAQQLVNNFFAQGSAIFNLNHVKNKSQRYFFSDNGSINKQIASGNYDNMTFSGKLMVGYDASIMEGLLLTPVAGLSYLKSSDESYKETGTTVANKQVNSKFGDRTDLIAGARLMGGTMNIMDFALYPEAHAFVTHKLNGKLAKGQSYLDGQTQPFINTPDKTAKTSYNLGLSVTARPDPKMEYGIGYDLDLASKYVAHQGTLKVRVNF
ncbi:MAG: autotransporter outer membrane beta-barrel domain-containing protein [Rickettsia endosymbiont of Argas persicus]